MITPLPLLRQAALLSLVMASPGALRAELIGSDDFSYGGGIILGQTGGTNWNWRNAAPAQHTAGKSDWDLSSGSPQIISGALQTTNAGVQREYNGPGEGLPSTTDEGVGAVNGGNVEKSVYYMVTVKAEDGAREWGLRSLDFGAERVFFGVPAGQPYFGISASGSGGTSALSVRRPVADVNYQLVAKLSFSAQTVALYMNPDLSLPESGNTPLVAMSYTATNWSTAVRLASAGTGTVSWDNLTVATRWTDLQPVVDTIGATYAFDSDTRQVSVRGVEVATVEGVTVARARTWRTRWSSASIPACISIPRTASFFVGPNRSGSESREI